MLFLTIVHKITFKYNNTTHEVLAKKFTGKRLKWYLITLHDGLNFVITPAGIVWLQENIPGETIHPKEFIQAVGSGLEAAGLVL